MDLVESFEELELADAIDYIEETGTAVIDVGVGSITLENVTGLTPDHFIFQPVRPKLLGRRPPYPPNASPPRCAA